MKNLHLQFKFVDRGGRDVYEIHNADDSKRLMHPLGSMRIGPTDGIGQAYCRVDWLSASDLAAGNKPEHDPDQLELELDSDDTKYEVAY